MRGAAAGETKTDHAGRPIVCITGAGVVTALGRGLATNWSALTAGRSGITTITRFDPGSQRTRIAATLEDGDGPQIDVTERTEDAARVALDEAVRFAGLGTHAPFPGPLIAGLPPVELPWTERLRLTLAQVSRRDPGYAALIGNPGIESKYLGERFTTGRAAARLAVTYRTSGIAMTVNTACATGATAVQVAVESIRRGEAGAVLVVAADASVSPDALLRFSLLSALSTANEVPSKAMRPFCLGRDGFVMGEGAAAFVLESAEHLSVRGGRCLGIVAGVGDTADAYHLTRSTPDGAQITRAMRAAIADAGLTVDAIDHVNAHGTSTPENDKMEALGLKAVFGNRVTRVPVTANKSMIGHTLSASGLVEAVFAMMTINAGLIPPTINQEIPDPTIQLDVVANTPRPMLVRTVLSNSFGFGGQNTCLVLRAAATA